MFAGAGCPGCWLHSLALRATVRVWTDAGKLAFGSCGAGPSIQAGLRGTAVYKLVTVVACVSWRAGACVVIDAVYAGRAICTWIAGALVDVDLTAKSCEA